MYSYINKLLQGRITSSMSISAATATLINSNANQSRFLPLPSKMEIMRLFDIKSMNSLPVRLLMDQYTCSKIFRSSLQFRNPLATPEDSYFENEKKPTRDMSNHCGVAIHVIIIFFYFFYSILQIFNRISKIFQLLSLKSRTIVLLELFLTNFQQYFNKISFIKASSECLGYSFI